MKSILIITYYWPPVAGSSVQRTVKFAKYLARSGWKTVVLTPRYPFTGSTEIDREMEKEIRGDIRIYGTKSIEIDRFYMKVKDRIKKISYFHERKNGTLKRILDSLSWRSDKIYNVIKKLLVPDNKIGWYYYAVKEGLRIIEEEKIKVLYSTSPYPVAHLIACSLKKRTRIPWVSDFRDPWTLQIMDPVPRVVNAINGILEKKFLRNSDRVISVVKEINEGFLNKYKTLEKEKISVIPNGFDKEDFSGDNAVPRDKFALVYAGRLYKEKRSLENFFEALKRLMGKGVLKNDYEVKLIGNTDERTLEAIKKYGLEEYVEISGYKNHKGSCGSISGADCLILILSHEQGGEYIITGKIYEYLYVKKPILAMVPEGAAADLIRKTKAGIVVDPKDIVGIENAIRKIYEEYYIKRKRLESNEDEIKKYDRELLAGKLERVLIGAMEEHGKS